MSIGHFYAEPSAVRPFFDPHHVSPAASSLFGSPSINNEPRLPLDRSRVACQTYHDTWPAPASYAPNSPTNFSVFPDRQTAPELVTHGLPNFPVPYVNGWSYGNTSNVPMDATESTGQANLYMTGGDSFSSVSSSTSSSSTSSSSFNNRLTVPSCWQTKTVSSNIVSSTYNPSSPCDGLQVSSWGPWMPENRRLEGTVSPKLTRIQPSPSYASAASSPGNMLAGWESDAAHSSSEPGRDPPFPGPRQQETTSSSKRQRRKLPQGKMSRPRHLRGKQSPKPPANLRSSECGSVPSSPPTARPSKANKNSKDTSTEDPSTPAEEEVIMADRKAADEFLVRSRLAGMGYKDIKERGGFSAAESTLRGRFRMLTKPKEARVRRPMWSDKDVGSPSFHSTLISWLTHYHRFVSSRNRSANLPSTATFLSPRRSPGRPCPTTLSRWVAPISSAFLPVASGGMSWPRRR